uniref:Uncharacterized protein n=1 Tax=Ditylenchus dipsaci TaxID=166011 RepID=A0A915CXW3_9BILA
MLYNTVLSAARLVVKVRTKNNSKKLSSAGAEEGATAVKWHISSRWDSCETSNTRKSATAISAKTSWSRIR